MRAAEIYRYPVQTTAFASSPLQDRIAQTRRDVQQGLDPLGQLTESVKAVHTPAYTRGEYTLYADDTLRLRVELGPLLWVRTERGSSLGGLLNTFA